MTITDIAVPRHSAMSSKDLTVPTGRNRVSHRALIERDVYEQAFGLLFADRVLPWCYASNQKGRAGHAIENRPPMSVTHMYTRAAAMLCLPEATAATPWLRKVEAAMSNDADSDLWVPRVHFLWAVLAERASDMIAVLDHCQAARACTSPSLNWRRSVQPGLMEDGSWFESIDRAIPMRLRVLEARANVWLDHLDSARAILSNCAEVDPGCLATKALLACREGQLVSAFRLSAEAIEMADDLATKNSLDTLDAFFARSDVLFERNELDAAEMVLGRALEICRQAGTRTWASAVEIRLAWVMLARGRSVEALERIGRLRDLDRSGDSALPSYLTRALDHLQIAYLLECRDLDGAARLLQALPPEDRAVNLVAELHLRAGRPDLAAAEVRSQPLPHVAGELRRLTVLARAEAQLGRQGHAEDAFLVALDLGRRDAFVRPFLESALQHLPLLRRMRRSSSDEYLSRLIVAAEESITAAIPETSARLVESMTPRERELLGYLPTHLTVGEIAAEMIVSKNTAKTHTKSLYRKLGASSRSQAVATARSIGLLQPSGTPSEVSTQAGTGG
jgi:DNA-binding CsgD family transcriptional regulator